MNGKNKHDGQYPDVFSVIRPIPDGSNLIQMLIWKIALISNMTVVAGDEPYMQGQKKVTNQYS